MALYAIGDVQGCFRRLEELLRALSFEPASDRLWFVGDLVNRGPDSAGVLRLVKHLDAGVVLGNHDLHLLAVAAGARPLKASDTFIDVLEAGDRRQLLDWLVSQPLVRRDDESGWAMVHAGLAPEWDVETASRLAAEVEAALRSHHGDREFLVQMYGDYPDRWDESLDGMERIRFIINAFTRIRFCNADGALDLDQTGPPGAQPAHLHPWFELWPHRSHRLVFGHWAALGAGDHGNVVSTDSGCVWGGRLTAARLDPGPVKFFSV